MQSPSLQLGTAASSVDGLAGSPSAVSSLNRNPAIRSSSPPGAGQPNLSLLACASMRECHRSVRSAGQNSLEDDHAAEVRAVDLHSVAAGRANAHARGYAAASGRLPLPRDAVPGLDTKLAGGTPAAVEAER